MEADRRSDVDPDHGLGCNAGDFDPWPSHIGVHCEWGPPGALLAAVRADLVVIIDVLSFSTSVTRAVDHGAVALSYSGDEIDRGGGRDAIAASLDAEIVAKDRKATDARFSLSPASLTALAPGDRLIFTSANGAACTSAASRSPTVLIGALTNRRAVAGVVDAALTSGEVTRCTLVASGERWTSTTAERDGLRPSIEDQLGAGAIASLLVDKGHVLSPEARLAAVAFEAMSDDLESVLQGCVSGRELIARGFASDVALASNLDSTTVVPRWDTGNPVREFRG